MTLGRMGILTVIVALVALFGTQVHALRAAPILEILSPSQGLRSTQAAIEIVGKTEPGARVEVNGTPLPATATGEFRHLLMLQRGLNTIMVSAQRRYSRSATIERQVMILTDSPLTHDYGKGI